MKKIYLFIFTFICILSFHEITYAVSYKEGDKILYPGTCISSTPTVLKRTGSETRDRVYYTSFSCLKNGSANAVCGEINYEVICEGFPEEGSTDDETNSSEVIDPPTSETLKSFCDVNKNPDIMRSFKMGGIALNILKIMIPILLIILGSIDFAQAIISSDEKQISKSTMKLVQRVTAGVVIFIIPTLINYVFDLVDNKATNRYKACYECLLDVSKCPDIPKVRA